MSMPVIYFFQPIFFVVRNMDIRTTPFADFRMAETEIHRFCYTTGGGLTSADTVLINLLTIAFC
jgi:hypothetical protein